MTGFSSPSLTATDLMLLERTIELSEASRDSGNHPFGALLADEAGHILIESGNSSARDRGIGHAELNVSREAARRFTPEFLLSCTLVTSVEPCCMCAGSVYWAGIGRLVYGMSEKRLAILTGDNPENLTMNMPCRQVFEAGQRKVCVAGPADTLEGRIIRAHQGFW
ncbi:nucleoside deaminase [Acetobacter sp. AN02]|uniref:nucleoside deaminase n=1 Tax=Acetobacter sp. AN02 TaxID=2894186 RepID=UPI0024341A79|nr:nucleoside deaminase [Acetobacter sp. AN02]MDG6094403.1 nucleoside deaminase [Acetobacter sp. AN02]